MIGMDIEFACACCGQIHRGMPTFAAEAPLAYYAVRDPQRPTRCQLSSDDCVIDETAFFVRGCIEIPVRGQLDPFIWGVWVSLSEKSFQQYRASYSEPKRAHIGPFFGWLNTQLTPYPDTLNLKTRVHLRDDGIRPFIELEPTVHPLAVEQREGISMERVVELHTQMIHPDGP